MMQRNLAPRLVLSVCRASLVAAVLILAACGGGGGGGDGVAGDGAPGGGGAGGGGGEQPRSGAWGGTASDGDVVNLIIEAGGVKEVFAEFCNGWRLVSFEPPIALAADGGFAHSDTEASYSGVVRTDGTATGHVRRAVSCGPAERSWSATRKSGRTDVKTPVGEIVTGAIDDASLGGALSVVGRVDSDFGTPIGDEIFRWSFSVRPSGSSATMAASPTTTFTPDVEGRYVVRLQMSNGILDGPSSYLPVLVGAPTAVIAGLSSSGFASLPLGVPVQLDAGYSSDREGGPLSYSWELLSAPTGSAAVILDPTSPRARLTADVGGTFAPYAVRLTVSDGHSSTSKRIDLLVDRRDRIAPFVDAGPNQEAVVGVPVQLSSAGSSTIDGAPFTSSWAVLRRPTGSVAAIVGASSASATFTPDLAGEYDIELTIKDSGGSPFGGRRTVRITAGSGNARPVARAGADRTASVGSTVTVDGSASSDANSDALQFQWALLYRPTGSTATLAGAHNATASFVPDRAGDYVLQLVARDASSSSQPDTVVITVK